MPLSSILAPAKLDVILRLVREFTDDGCMAELGVFNGGTIYAMQCADPDRHCIAYDTFEGMPPNDDPTEHHRPGEFAARPNVVADLEAAGIECARGVFPDTAIDVPYSVVHLDADTYASTRAGLEFFVPRAKVIVLDDWKWDHCPGVERAVRDLGLTATQTVPYQAVIHFPYRSHQWLRPPNKTTAATCPSSPPRSGSTC